MINSNDFELLNPNTTNLNVNTQFIRNCDLFLRIKNKDFMYEDKLTDKINILNIEQISDDTINPVISYDLDNFNNEFFNNIDNLPDGTYDINIQLINTLYENLIISEISPDKTEIKIISFEYSKYDKLNTFEVIEALNNYLYIDDDKYLIVNAVVEDEILYLKLYSEITNEINNTNCNIGIQILDETIEKFNFVREIEPESPDLILNNPNFSLKVKSTSFENNSSTEFESLEDILNSDEHDPTVFDLEEKLSQKQYTYVEFEKDNEIQWKNFIFYSNAKYRLDNAIYKISKILNNSESKKNEIISTFDSFEYFLYYNKCKKLSEQSGIDFYNDVLLDENSYIHKSAINYDDFNINAIVNLIPAYIVNDENNIDMILLLNVFAQYYDYHIVKILNIKKVHNQSEDIYKQPYIHFISQIAESLGIDVKDLDNDFSNIWQYFFGDVNISDNTKLKNDSSISETNQNVVTVSRKDLSNEILNRLIQNWSYILKTKGTKNSIKRLMNCYGIPETALKIREYSTSDDTSSVNKTTEFNVIKNYLRFGSQDSVFNTGTIHLGDHDNIEYIEMNVRYNILDMENPHEIVRFVSSDDIVYSTISIQRVSDNTGIVYINGNTYQSTINNIKINFANDGYIKLNIVRENVITISNFNDGIYNPQITGTPFILWENNKNNKIIFNYNEIQIQDGYDIKNVRLYTEPISFPDIMNHTIFEDSISLQDSANSQILGNEIVGIFNLNTPINFMTNTTINNEIITISDIFMDINLIDIVNNPPEVEYPYNFGTDVYYNSTILADVFDDRYIDKVRLIDVLDVDTLSPYTVFIDSEILSNSDRQVNISKLYNQKDSNKVSIYLGTSDLINEEIINRFNNYNFDNIIGSPDSVYQDTYKDLNLVRKQFNENYLYNKDINTYDLFQYFKAFNSSFFKQVQYVIPARAKSEIGIRIEPSLLRRCKEKISKPSSTNNTYKTNIEKIETVNKRRVDIFQTNNKSLDFENLINKKNDVNIKIIGKDSIECSLKYQSKFINTVKSNPVNINLKYGYKQSSKNVSNLIVVKFVTDNVLLMNEDKFTNIEIKNIK